MRRTTVSVCAGLGLLAGGNLLTIGCSPSPVPPRPPNIIFVMADDHAERTIGDEVG